MEKSLRILHLTAGSDPGGLSRYLLDLSERLLKLGHQVTIAGERGAWQDRFDAAHIPWIEAPLKGYPVTLYLAARRLNRWLKDQPVDIIHSHYRRCTLVGRRLQPDHGVPILYTVHQPRISLHGIWGKLTDFGDHTHAPSADARDWLIQDAHLSDGHISLIPHGIDLDRFPRRTETQRLAARQALGIAGDRILAAFVGRLDVPKNVLWMCDLAEAALKQLPSLHIVIAGDGPDKPALLRQIQTRKLSSCITLLGDIAPLPVYQAADALIAPSEREGFLLVGAEAMSVGVPVFRTSTGGAAEMIVDGVTGKAVPAEREFFIKEAIAFLFDRARLRFMGERAATFVRENFSLDSQVERTIALYSSRVGKLKSHSIPYTLPAS